MRDNFVGLRDECMLVWRRKVRLWRGVVVGEELLGGGDKKGKVVVDPKRVCGFSVNLVLGEEVEVVRNIRNGGGVKKWLGDGVER